MREVQIIEYCDVCWRDSKSKVPAAVSLLIALDGKAPRRVAGCAKHGSVLEGLSHMVSTYGTIEHSPDSVRASTAAQAKPEPSPEGAFACKCGKRFPAERNLNMHLGQALRYVTAGEHEAAR